MRALIICTACLVANPAAAEMILAEFGWDQPEPVSLPGEYRFRAGNSGLGLPCPESCAIWTADVSTFPYNDTADSDLLAKLNNNLTAINTGGPRVAFHNAGQNINAINPMLTDSFPFSRVWIDSTNSDPDGTHWDAYVPQLGVGLFGYTITRAERTITALGQTVAFYGETVDGTDPPLPEPGSWFLLLVGCAHLVGRRRR